MNKSEIIEMIINKIKPTKEMYDLTYEIVKNTIDALEEEELIYYSKCTEEKQTNRDIEAPANDKEIFNLTKKEIFNRR